MTQRLLSSSSRLARWARIFGVHRQTLITAEGADGIHGAIGVLERLAKQGLGLFRIAANALVQRGGIARHLMSRQLPEPYEC